MTEWKEKNCIPSATAQVLSTAEVETALGDLPGWSVTTDGKRITRSWRVTNFLEALAFFQRVGEIAEANHHHPDLHVVGYRNITVELWTHVVDGLTINDLIVAAKINEVPIELQSQN